MPISILQGAWTSLRNRVAIVGGLTVCMAAPLAAQLPPQAAPTEKECRTALRIVEKGHPAKKEAWALALAPRCPLADAVPALAAMVRSLRTEADTAVLFEALQSTTGVFDEGLLLAALDVLGDNTATMNSRIATTIMMASQISSSILVIEWSGAISGRPDCARGDLAIARSRGAAPVAATLRAAMSRLQSVVSAPETPAAVRNAATCVLPFVEGAARHAP